MASFTNRCAVLMAAVLIALLAAVAPAAGQPVTAGGLTGRLGNFSFGIPVRERPPALRVLNPNLCLTLDLSRLPAVAATARHHHPPASAGQHRRLLQRHHHHLSRRPRARLEERVLRMHRLQLQRRRKGERSDRDPPFVGPPMPAWQQQATPTASPPTQARQKGPPRLPPRSRQHAAAALPLALLPPCCRLIV